MKPFYFLLYNYGLTRHSSIPEPAFLSVLSSWSLPVSAHGSSRQRVTTKRMLSPFSSLPAAFPVSARWPAQLPPTATNENKYEHLTDLVVYMDRVWRSSLILAFSACYLMWGMFSPFLLLVYLCSVFSAIRSTNSMLEYDEYSELMTFVR